MEFLFTEREWNAIQAKWSQRLQILLQWWRDLGQIIAPIFITNKEPGKLQATDFSWTHQRTQTAEQTKKSKPGEIQHAGKKKFHTFAYAEQMSSDVLYIL